MFESLADEWEKTYEEMYKFRPEINDAVLCRSPEIHEGKVVGLNFNMERFYSVQLATGEIVDFAEIDVMKRKVS